MIKKILINQENILRNVWRHLPDDSLISWNDNIAGLSEWCRAIVDFVESKLIICVCL